MPPLGQNNHATFWDKQKVTQPLWTKKYATSRDKKNYATSWNQKKSRNLLRKKIMQPFGRRKKITQPLRTKKNTQLLGTKIPHTGDIESLDRCG